MDENATTRHTLLDKRDGSWEVPNELNRALVRQRDHFVLKVLGKERFDAVGDLKDVCDVGCF